MDSWGRSTCYPQRTFYPLSDGPSTWNHRITMTDFRLCSTCQSRSQAGLCHCTQQLISDQLEPTIARLRYSLGGDRPSQTTHHAGSRPQLHGARLDIREQKGGISTLPPHRLALALHRLPPILHIHSLIPLQSYSKGAWGSFRLTAGTPHLHGEFNFAELMLEIAGKSLRHSCRSELTRQGISLP